MDFHRSTAIGAINLSGDKQHKEKSQLFLESLIKLYSARDTKPLS